MGGYRALGLLCVLFLGTNVLSLFRRQCTKSSRSHLGNSILVAGLYLIDYTSNIALYIGVFLVISKIIHSSYNISS